MFFAGTCAGLFAATASLMHLTTADAAIREQWFSNAVSFTHQSACLLP